MIASTTSPSLLPLRESLQTDKLVLFIGADLPIELTGLPGHLEIASQLADQHQFTGLSSLSAVSQRIHNHTEFIEFISRKLDTTGKKPGIIHKEIAHIVTKHQISTIITTTRTFA